MEDFIRENFDIVDYEKDDGSIVEGFKYKTKDNNWAVTDLNYFLDNIEQYNDLIEHWEDEGMNVPDY